jgi:hypothetical protein
MGVLTNHIPLCLERNLDFYKSSIMTKTIFNILFLLTFNTVVRIAKVFFVLQNHAVNSIIYN